MSATEMGRILAGSEQELRRSRDAWAAQPVDQEVLSETPPEPARFLTTIAAPVSVSGPGTFLGKATRTFNLEPETEQPGWALERLDLSDSLPIRVNAYNVWTTFRNIVLCSGSPHNYVRMVEHFVALKAGMGLDSLLVRTNSGDPPLFDRGSMDLVEAIEKVGLKDTAHRLTYVTVREPVTVGGPNGSFLTFLPHSAGERPRLRIDCAVDFPSAIGRQRIRFDVDRNTFRHGALARTNTTLGMMIYCKTIGKLFADVRHLGYTRNNILIAGRKRYLNQPKLVHNGKSLEAVWHRAVLDLLAAVALIENARYAGEVISYKAGHGLDVEMIKKLHKNRLLVRLNL